MEPEASILRKSKKPRSFDRLGLSFLVGSLFDLAFLRRLSFVANV